MADETIQGGERRGPLAGLRRGCRALATLALVGVVLAVAGRRFVLSQLDEEIRAQVEAELQAHYANFRVDVHSARRRGDKGVEIRGIVISEPKRGGGESVIASIDELFAACPTGLTDLISQRPRVEELVIRRPRLRAVRRPDGSWNVARLLPLPHLGSRPRKVTVLEGTIELSDGVGEGARRMTFRAVHLEAIQGAAPQAPFASRVAGPLLRVNGWLTGEQVKRIELEGWVAPDEGLWTIGGSVKGLEVSSELRAALPGDWASHWPASPSVEGRGELSFRVTNVDCGDESYRYAVTGSLLDGRITDSRWPYPLTELQARFFCDNGGARLDELSARAGPAQLRLAGERTGWRPDSPWTLRARVDHLPLDGQFAAALPEEAGELWRKFSPAGMVNADLQLVSDGRGWKPDLRVECVDVSFAYFKFPYRLRDGRGLIHWKDNFLKLEGCRATAEGRVVRLEGEVRDPGRTNAGWVEVSLDDPAPLDDRLLDALDPKSQAVVRALHPHGAVTFWGRFENGDAESPGLRRWLRIGLHRCSVRYDKFPYPVYDICGELEMDDRGWSFRDLEGRNDSGLITCRGQWSLPSQGGALTLEFTARDVALEDELRDALRPDAKRLWMGIRPRGVMDRLTVRVRYDAQRRSLALEAQAEKWPPTQNVEGRSITVEPVWLPYRLDNVTGSFEYRDGEVTLRKVRGVHGRGVVELEGSCQFGPEGPWTVRLSRLTADRLTLDRQFTVALPDRLRRALEGLHLSGPVNVDGTLALSAGGRPGAPIAGTWDLVADVTGAALNCGLRLDDIHGGVRLIGESGPGGFWTRGELALDSVVYRGAQLTQVRGPLWIDDSQIAFGAWSGRRTGGAPPRSVAAKVFDGALTVDARVELGAQPRFSLYCHLMDGDLAQISQELMPKSQNLTGKAYGFMRLDGALQGLHTWRGGGKVRLREADIYRVPLMVAMLSLLSVRPPEATAFTSADVDFRIQGEHFYLDHIDFTGDAISLRGDGEMDFSRRIDLKFYAMVGRDQFHIPILRPVLGEASRQFLLIEVLGPLDDPVVNKTAFPGLNEMLQQIFPEAPGPSATRLNLPTPRQVLQRSGLLPKR